MIPDPRERPTLTVEQAGAFLGLGRSAAYAAVGRGEIPTIKFGRRIIVPTAALLRLLAVDDGRPPPGGMTPVREAAAPAGRRLLDDVSRLASSRWRRDRF